MTSEEIKLQVARLFAEVDEINRRIESQRQIDEFNQWSLQQTMQASEQACMEMATMFNNMNM